MKLVAMILSANTLAYPIKRIHNKQNETEGTMAVAKGKGMRWHYKL